jgi:uncharacterized protein
MKPLVNTLRLAITGSSGILPLCLCLSLSGCTQPASRKPSPEATKQLLKLRGYEFNAKSFLSAAAANDVIAVNGFLAAGMDPNVRDEISGATALISGASHANPEVINALLQGGADINVKDNGGYTAVLRAIQNQHYEISDMLLAQPKLDLNAQGSDGKTILMSYVWRDQENVVRKLLERRADPNLSDQDGDTALHAAAQRGNVNILRMLLDASANPNARNKLGGTPLMWTGSFGHEEAARVLVEKGADAALKDKYGMTASAWAEKNKRDDTARFLREAEKKR